MHIFFFGRRESDFDHFAPLAFFLKKKTSFKITFTDIFMDPTMIWHKKDKRFNFLKKHNIKFSFSAISRIFYENEKFKTNFIVLKILKKILSFVYQFYAKFFYLIKIIFLASNNRGKSLFITDHNPIKFGNIYWFLKFFAKINKIKVISIPHGLILHKGYKKKFLNKYSFSNNNYDFDKVLVSNIFQKKIEHNNNLNNTKVLGSLRFSIEWIKILKNIYKKKLRKKNKINVLFIDEKKGQNHRSGYIEWIKHSKQIELLDYLKKDREINLIIKNHPSMNFWHKINNNNKKFFKFNESFTTFQLIYNSDIIIGFSSSSIIDAFFLNKKILIPEYISSFKLIYKDYFNYMVMKNFKEFKIFYKKLKKSNKKNNYMKQNKNFFRDITHSIKDNFVLTNYINFLKKNYLTQC